MLGLPFTPCPSQLDLTYTTMLNTEYYVNTNKALDPDDLCSPVSYQPTKEFLEVGLPLQYDDPRSNN